LRGSEKSVKNDKTIIARHEGQGDLPLTDYHGRTFLPLPSFFRCILTNKLLACIIHKHLKFYQRINNTG